jgi:[ribosomal protein S18]-alanine N-acetyltransferase
MQRSRLCQFDFEPRPTIPLLIRAATSADLPDLMALALESKFAAHWSESQYRQIFSQSTPRRIVLVASDKGVGEDRGKGDLLAFVVARVVQQDWEIENLVVRTTSQRRGVATRLLNHIRKSAKSENAMKLFLEVRRSSAAARALYKKFGFKNCGYRSRYYSDPADDAVLYQLIL